MTSKYRLYIPVWAAELYYAWEFGAMDWRSRLAGLDRDSIGRVDMLGDTTHRPVLARRWTRKDVDRYASIILAAVSYQEGRLGRPLTAGWCEVTTKKAEVEV